LYQKERRKEKEVLTSWSEDNLRVFANFFSVRSAVACSLDEITGVPVDLKATSGVGEESNDAGAVPLYDNWVAACGAFTFPVLIELYNQIRKLMPAFIR
jgi:hypothetical protein